MDHYHNLGVVLSTSFFMVDSIANDVLKHWSDYFTLFLEAFDFLLNIKWDFKILNLIV